MLNTADAKLEKVPQTGKAGMAAWFAGRYTRQGLWSLFLMCAFPLHAWTLILAFRDISWLIDRTNLWDAVGVTCYGLIFAFIESLLFFVVAAVLGYITPSRWNVDRRVAFLAVLALVAALWAMLDQLFFLIGTGFPGWLIGLLVSTGHPARFFMVLLGGIVGLTVLLPALWVARSDRVVRGVWGMIERLSILTIFYLVLDLIGLVIVIVRNV